jgi:hypothetical protein
LASAAAASATDLARWYSNAYMVNSLAKLFQALRKCVLLRSLNRHSRESGNPVSFVRTPLGPRFRGDDKSFAALSRHRAS